jgi:hypothetical protein
MRQLNAVSDSLVVNGRSWPLNGPASVSGEQVTLSGKFSYSPKSKAQSV